MKTNIIFSSCTYEVQWAYGIPMCLFCVSVYLLYNTIQYNKAFIKRPSKHHSAEQKNKYKCKTRSGVNVTRSQ